VTDRELRNAEWKNRLRLDAEAHCEFIDMMEEELKDRERMNAQLSEELDRLNQREKNAA